MSEQQDSFDEILDKVEGLVILLFTGGFFFFECVFGYYQIAHDGILAAGVFAILTRSRSK